MTESNPISMTEFPDYVQRLTIGKQNKISMLASEYNVRGLLHYYILVATYTYSLFGRNFKKYLKQIVK